MTGLTDQYLAALVKHDPSGLPLSKGVRFQNLVTPRAALLADVPPTERTSREDMIDAANRYFESIEHGDGEIAPFAEDCERH